MSLIRPREHCRVTPLLRARLDADTAIQLDADPCRPRVTFVVMACVFEDPRDSPSESLQSATSIASGTVVGIAVVEDPQLGARIEPAGQYLTARPSIETAARGSRTPDDLFDCDR